MSKNIYCYLHGGLGNRLFQVASAYSIAKEQGKNMLIANNSERNPHSNINYYQTIFQRVPMTKGNDVDEIFIEPAENSLMKMDIPNSDKNLLLKGYFQDEEYFINHRMEIIDMFRMNERVKQYLDAKYFQNKQVSYYFIHIRRGDYVNNPLYVTDLELYYNNAIRYITQKEVGNPIHFYVVSDDIPFSRSMKLLKKIKHTFVTEDELATLYLMSLCKGGICANSSFSWWGSYLIENPDKIVTFPDKWFTNNWNIKIGWKGSVVLSNTYHILKNTTFIIPLRIDSDDRLINMKIQLKYLMDNFDTNIVLIEDGKKSFFKDLQLNNREREMIDYEYIYNDNEIFHCTKILNQCLKKVKTEVLCVTDIDALIPINSYIESEMNILLKNADIIQPFSNKPPYCMCYYIEQKDKYKVNIKNITDIMPSCKTHPAGNGFLIFVRTSEYIRMGAENEEFVSWAPEDNERYLRAKHHSLKYIRLDYPVFHLEHERNEYCTIAHSEFKKNWDIYVNLLLSKYGIRKLDIYNIYDNILGENTDDLIEKHIKKENKT